MRGRLAGVERTAKDEILVFQGLLDISSRNNFHMAIPSLTETCLSSRQ